MPTTKKVAALLVVFTLTIIGLIGNAVACNNDRECGESQYCDHPGGSCRELMPRSQRSRPQNNDSKNEQPKGSKKGGGKGSKTQKN
jgi:hypothetical protein